jgi:hypothetical protein
MKGAILQLQQKVSSVAMTLDVTPLDGATYDVDHVTAVTSVDVVSSGTYTIDSTQWNGSFGDPNNISGDPTTTVVSVATAFVAVGSATAAANEAADVVNYTYTYGDSHTTSFFGLVLGFDPTYDLYLVQQYSTYFGPGNAGNQFGPSHYTVLSGDANNGPGTYLSGFDGVPADDAIDLSFTLPLTFSTATACYCAGTRILTQRGEIAVEDLQVGDLVVGLGRHGGGLRPVIWIGHTSIDLDRHPNPMHVTPVRIRAGAIAEGMPHRDLLVSPEHAILLPEAGRGDVLVPAGELVNGATILRESPAGALRYFHIELERHDILLAEGLPAESYLDTGNRHVFANAGTCRALHADFRPRDWQADGCAALLLGAEARPLHARLLARALAFGHVMTDDPALSLSAAGDVLTPLWAEPGSYVYLLPPGTRELRLRSRVAVPNDAAAHSVEAPLRGVALAGLALDGVAISLDSPVLASGFLPPDSDCATAWRWSVGEATLALPPSPEQCLLELSLHRGWFRYWAEPQEVMAVQRRA